MDRANNAKIYVARSATVHILLLSAYTQCMNYVTKTFLLVSFLVKSKQLLCFVHAQGQKSKEKPSIQQRIMSGFITIPFY